MSGLLGQFRILGLLDAASRAEALRWQRWLARLRQRALFAVVAVVFALVTLIALHVVLWALVAGWFGTVGGAVAVAVLDLVLVLGLLLLASRWSSVDAQAEAAAVRDQALGAAAQRLMPWRALREDTPDRRRQRR